MKPKLNILSTAGNSLGYKHTEKSLKKMRVLKKMRALKKRYLVRLK